MAITATDIVFHLSCSTAAGGDVTTSTAAQSLGGYVSTTVCATTINNLFDDITGDENAASQVDYRCFFIRNTHATLTYTSPYVWISAETTTGASISYSIDDATARDADATTLQACVIADSTTAPATATTFITTTSKATGKALGSLAPDEVRAVWLKRTAANTVAVDSDDVTISVEGDTAA